MSASAPPGEVPGSRSEVIEAVPVRHPGRWVAAVAVLVVVGLLVRSLASNGNIAWSVIGQYLFNSVVLHGVLVTIELTVLSMLIGVAIGIALAVMRLSPNPILAAASGFYIWLFRGTPVLVQLVIWFNIGLIFPRLAVGVPFTGINTSADAKTVITGFTAALLGLGLNEGAYMAEIVRAGILSVDRGQTEAAHALGMTGALTMRRIVLPQAMRVIVPPTGNEFISMLKTTALVVVIAGKDLTTVVTNIYSRNFNVIELLAVASIWYLVLTSIASTGQYFIERRFARGSVVVMPPGLLMRLAGSLLGGRRDRSPR